MNHYIIGKLLDKEKVDIFDVQTAVKENYPDFEDEEFDVMNAKETNAELLDEVCLSDDASEGLKYLGKRTQCSDLPQPFSRLLFCYWTI